MGAYEKSEYVKIGILWHHGVPTIMYTNILIK